MVRQYNCMKFLRVGAKRETVDVHNSESMKFQRAPVGIPKCNCRQLFRPNWASSTVQCSISHLNRRSKVAVGLNMLGSRKALVGFVKLPKFLYSAPNQDSVEVLNPPISIQSIISLFCNFVNFAIHIHVHVHIHSFFSTGHQKWSVYPGCLNS